jgi:acyl dehydratase
LTFVYPKRIFSTQIARFAGYISPPAERPGASIPPEHRGLSMEEQDLPVAIDERHFEDYPEASRVVYGPIVVGEDEVIEFARRFDPQPFHVDRERAARSPFGGVIASGWHTASMMMRVLVDRYLPRAAGLGSPGMDELRWPAPVRPGDRLYVRVTVVEARRSASKPDRGLVRLLIEVVKEDGTVAMSVRAMTLMRCRRPGGDKGNT